MNKKDKLIFEEKKIRSILYKDKLYFSVVDVVNVLIKSENPKSYWKVLKHRLNSEGSEVVTFCNQLKLEASDGKKYLTDCADKQGIFRIIQSIPSKKAEPFKMWLAQVGSERIDEIENPELAQERMKEIYELKGYPKDWIDKRLRGIAIRQNLTDEWRMRAINENKEYAILTDEISRATFGKGVKDYKKHKNLDKENLRDNMTDWELILTMVGEKATTDITQKDDSFGFDECKSSAKKGGEIAGRTRKDLEKSLGKSLVSKDNYLDVKTNKKKSKKLVKIK